MKVILTQTVEKLGIVGDTKEVKDGFARNYLIPKKFAISVSDPQAKSIIAKVKKEKEEAHKEIGVLKQLAAKLSEKTIEIKAKAGEGEKLFGSVTSEDIAKELKLDKHKIEMEPIKTKGEHEVIIKLGHNIEAKIKINIMPTVVLKTKKSK